MAIASPMGTESSAVRSSVDCITNIDLGEWRRDGVGRLWPVANNYCGGQDIYGLALRMLWNREDAEDATQEILVRVVTRLSQFDFRSKLKTWVYRVAVNYILDVKKSPVERMQLSFDRFAEDLADGLSADGEGCRNPRS